MSGQLSKTSCVGGVGTACAERVAAISNRVKGTRADDLTPAKRDKPRHPLRKRALSGAFRALSGAFRDSLAIVPYSRGFPGQPRNCAILAARTMPRMARVVAEAVPHHITQRGNNRQDTFFLPDDRSFYLETLRAKCRDHGVAVLGYCVMTNHVHLVVVPSSASALARALGQAHGKYARWFNRRYRRSGHLWQNRFYSSALGGERLETALAYVDLNPVRAKLVKHAEEYEWSSARAHLSGCEGDPLLDSWDWAELGFGADWAERLAAHAAADQGELLREATYGGRPFGDEAFVADMERTLKRPLTKRSPGRKPKALAAAAQA